MTRLGSERYSVQNPLIKYAMEIGWEYVSHEDALWLRGEEEGIVFKRVFIEQLKRLNPDFMSDDMAATLLGALERVQPNIEGNLVVWEHLKGLRTVYVPGDKRERNVVFMDTRNIENNTFHVTDEFTFTNGNRTIRPDVVFLINGIPVIMIETKAANKIDGMNTALEQVKRYHRDCPELLVMLQIYAITHILRYYYSATWNTTAKWLFNWKEETGGGILRPLSNRSLSGSV